MSEGAFFRDLALLMSVAGLSAEKRRSRNALSTTVTELKLIAAAPIIGVSLIPSIA